MIDDQFLPYFITEEIYSVKESPTPTKTPETAPSEPTAEAVIPLQTTEIAPPPEEKVHELAIWTPPLTAADKVLVSNILKAIDKDLPSAYLMEGINSYKPQFKTLLCFGYQKELELKSGKSVPLYTPVTIDQRTFLTAASPADLQEDKKQKALLWEALQKLFLKP